MQQIYSAIAITMPKVKISHLQKSTFIYEIDVATRWAKWHLQKRYTQFQDLHKKLQSQFNELPQFPSSILNFFIGESQEQAQQYQQILESFLQQTSKRKDIVNTTVYIEFLQLDKHSPMMLAKKPKFLYEFEMEQRINDEGKVILDYYYDENYIVFCTGNDSPIEKFNSLVANSKFPWEDDEEVEFVLPLGTVQCWLKKKEKPGYRRVWARNYPIETRKFLFSPSAMIMVVGLSDGAIQIFRLIQKPRYIYYELVKMLTVHQQQICGLFLDEYNSIIYSASTDGFINIIDSTRSIPLDTMELSSSIVAFHADITHRRLFVSLAEGSIDIYEYTYNAKLKLLHTLCTPVDGQIRSMFYDPMKNYLFSGCYENGEIYVFEIGKPGHEKISKQIGFLKNKQKILDLIWKFQKMQLMVTTESGQIFFWDMVKGRQIYMLKAFDECEMSKTMLIRKNNSIITASRGRKVKVNMMIDSSGKYLMPGEIQQHKSRNKDKYKSEEKFKICTKQGKQSKEKKSILIKMTSKAGIGSLQILSNKIIFGDKIKLIQLLI